MGRRSPNPRYPLPAPLRSAPSDAPKRQAILDAALDLFSERGFHGTAVPEVAARAGVGAGTVYRYFASKEALVNELFQLWKHALGRAILEGFPLHFGTREQLHEIWKRLHHFANLHPKAVQFLELHHHHDYLDSRSRATEDALLGPLRMFVVEAQKKKTMRAMTPEVLMAMVYGTFTALLRAGWERRIAVTPSILFEAEEALWEAIRR